MSVDVETIVPGSVVTLIGMPSITFYIVEVLRVEHVSGVSWVDVLCIARDTHTHTTELKQWSFGSEGAIHVTHVEP